MKKILIPTDFSDNAAKALDIGLELINRLGAVHLTIFHVYNIPTSPTAYVSFVGHLLQDAEAEMNRTVNRIQPKLGKEVVLQTEICRAETIPAISKWADNYDLVIMGTQGASGLKEIFLGSITNGVIKRTTTPVLVIPSNYPFSGIKNIVVSLDSNSFSDTKGVQWIKVLKDIFSADLMLFHTEEQAADRGFDAGVVQLFDQPGYSIDFNFIGKNVRESIDEMVEDYDVDLLCMVKRKRGFWASIFHQSVTSKEVFHSKIPLLVLHDG